MIYSVMIANGNSKQEILTDKQNAEIYAELGLALAEFVPPELITDENWGKYHKNCVNNWEVRFANILYKFYCDCLQDKTLYNEEHFLFVLSNGGGEYAVPRSKTLFDNKENRAVTIYLLSQKSEYLNKIDYMIAVAYELVRHKITLNKCKECGKWFVAYNKVDTLYCSDCATTRTKRRKANEALARIITHNCSVRMSYNNDYTSEYYKKYRDIQQQVYDKQPNTKTATLAELQEYGEWLKGIKKAEFPKSKEEV